LWCTHATQAWRQSESGVWSTFPAEMRRNSLLLVTRFDKIVGEKDRAKVIKRVEQETEELFAEVFPVSLLQAMRAGHDEAKWIESGAEAFSTALFDIIHRIVDEGHPEPGDAGKPAITPDAAEETEVGQSLIARTFERMMAIRNTPVFKIQPRRVEAKTERLLRTERPTAESGPTMVTFADHIVGTNDAMPLEYRGKPWGGGEGLSAGPTGRVCRSLLAHDPKQRRADEHHPGIPEPVVQSGSHLF
jgi:hypothetical protein